MPTSTNKPNNEAPSGETIPPEPEIQQPVDPKPADPKPVSTGRRAAPTEATKSQVKTREAEEDNTPQSYVWLANGEVVLANNEDLPGAAGVNNPYGHWIKDGS